MPTSSREDFVNGLLGSFSFSNTGTTSQFGSINGTGFLTSDQEFVFFEFFEADFSGDRLFAFAGVPTTTFTTTTLDALGTKFFALQNDFVLNSNIPFVSTAFGGSLTPGEAEGIADTVILFDASGSSTAQRVWGHRTIAIVGQGTSQTSVSSLAGGEVLLDSGGRLFLDGGVVATARLVSSSSAGGVLFIDGEVASVDDALLNDFFGGTAPDYFVLDGTEVNASDAFINRGLTPSEGDGADQAKFFPNNAALVVTGTTESTLGTRTTRQMFGYSGGATQTYTGASTTPSSTTLFRNAASDPSDIVVFTSAETNKVQADIDVIGFAIGSGSSISLSTGEILQTEFGDDDAAFGDSTPTKGESVFVDNFTFGAADSEIGTGANFFSSPGVSSSDSVIAADLYMVRVDVASEFNNGFLPSGVTVCDCEFLTWGFWGAGIDRSSGNEELIHLANWVAGKVPAFADITTLGSASYSGHAIGTVFNAGSVYQAIGDFALNFNFANPASSTGTITNFDTANFNLAVSSFAAGSGSVSDPVLTNPNVFSGSITDAGATGRNGSFIGSFFEDLTGTDKAAEMGGHFQVDNGTDYVASGIFAAAK